MGSVNLQSGFVLAVVLAAVLFAGYAGVHTELGVRILQVAIGVLLAFAVVAGSTAFIRSSNPPVNTSTDASSQAADRQFIHDVNKKATIASTVNAGVGIFALIIGLGLLRRFRTVPFGLLLGGLLLVLFGGVSTTAGSAGGDATTALSVSYLTLLGTYLGQSDRATDIAHFIVLALGAAAVLAYAFYDFEDWTGATPPPEPAA